MIWIVVFRGGSPTSKNSTATMNRLMKRQLLITDTPLSHTPALCLLKRGEEKTHTHFSQGTLLPRAASLTCLEIKTSM